MNEPSVAVVWRPSLSGPEAELQALALASYLKRGGSASRWFRSKDFSSADRVLIRRALRLGRNVAEVQPTVGLEPVSAIALRVIGLLEPEHRQVRGSA